jgi:hypothetical protein
MQVLKEKFILTFFRLVFHAFQLICKGYERLLLPKLKASEDSSVETPTERSAVDDFLNNVIGSEESGDRPADIVILDQHIELNSGELLVLGTDIAHELRIRHYKGLVLIRSANSSAVDCESYLSSGEVDGCLGKAQSHSDLVRSITQAYWGKQKTTSKLEDSPEMHAEVLLHREETLPVNKKGK